MERERDRLVDARQRLVADRRRGRTDVRVGKGQYVGADDQEHFQRLSRELELVQAKLVATPAPLRVDAGDPQAGIRLAARAGLSAQVHNRATGRPSEDPASGASAYNTVRAYGADWREWTNWCAERGEVPLPARPDAIAAHVLELASRPVALATIERRLAAVGRRHRDGGHDPPSTRDLVVQRAMARLRRGSDVTPRARRVALTPDELRLLLAHTDPVTLAGSRDRALLLIGARLVVHRAQLVALDVADVVETGRELRVSLRRPGSEQGAEVRIIRRLDDVAFCPVVALLDWLVAADIAEGAIWRRLTRSCTVGGRLTPQSVNLIVKRACARAGLDPVRYSGDSLRPSGLT